MAILKYVKREARSSCQRSIMSQQGKLAQSGHSSETNFARMAIIAYNGIHDEI